VSGSAFSAREPSTQTHPLRVLRALCGKKKKNLTTEGTENTESQYRCLLSVTGKPVSYLPLESSAAQAVV